LQIRNGGLLQYRKSFFGYMSTIYCLINAKFGTMKQNHAQTDRMTKIPNFENSRWRTAANLKRFYRYISDRNHPISMKIGMLTELLVPRTVT